MARREICREWQIGPCERADWTSAPGLLDAARVTETVAAVPPDAATVLDAGCGSGWLANRLAESHAVVAVDYVLEGLRQVRTPRCRADLARLPFGARRFDLVCCCETLEHLDDGRLAAALGELARVSRRYVLVTVPHDEDLERRAWRCPKCGARFSPYGHVRSFREHDLRALFASNGIDGMQCLAAKGIVVRKGYRQNAWLESLRPPQLGWWSRGEGAVCPRCGWPGYGPRLSNIWRVWANALRAANALIHPVRETRALWLLALYRTE
jgi:SAM-dependent methyltransferase